MVELGGYKLNVFLVAEVLPLQDCSCVLFDRRGRYNIFRLSYLNQISYDLWAKRLPLTQSSAYEAEKKVVLVGVYLQFFSVAPPQTAACLLHYKNLRLIC